MTEEELNRELIVIQANVAALNLRLMELIDKRKKGKEHEDGKVDQNS